MHLILPIFCQLDIWNRNLPKTTENLPKTKLPKTNPNQPKLYTNPKSNRNSKP